MPPRYTYWTIILEGKPTAFRAHTRDELLPTLKQLQTRHPDAVLLWFARGRLWESPEAARAALFARRAERDGRGAGWRPGGAHRDPRDRFKVPRDEKRRRFAERLRRDRTEPQGNPPPEKRGPREGQPAERRWKPAAPAAKRLHPRGPGPDWKPGRPQGPGGGDKRGWGPPRGRGRPPAGGRGGRKPGGGGRTGSGGGGSPR